MESLFNKVAGLKVCNILKKRLQHRCFSVRLAKFLRTPSLKNDLRMTASEYLVNAYVPEQMFLRTSSWTRGSYIVIPEDFPVFFLCINKDGTSNCSSFGYGRWELKVFFIKHIQICWWIDLFFKIATHTCDKKIVALAFWAIH